VKPVCVAGAEEASPDEDPTRAPLVTSVASVDAAEAHLAGAESSLRAFAVTRIFSAKGSKSGQLLFERIRSAKKALLHAGFEARKARRDPAMTDIARVAKQVRDAATLADQVASDVRTFAEDGSNVDSAAEAKERARIEAAEAVARRKAQAEEEARARVDAERARRDEAARQLETAASARRTEAEARRLEAERLVEAKKAEALRVTEALALKKRADAEAKERAAKEAEALARQAEAVKAAEMAKKAVADEVNQRAKLERDFGEADSRVRSDLDQCSQTVAMLTMVEMSSRGQTKVGDAKNAVQNHKDKLRALLGRLAAAKAKIPLKAAVEEMNQCNEESKALAKETARLIAAAKSIKN
jgi:hypothetical protein